MDSRLNFPILSNWTEMSFFSAEIDYSIYEYQFISGLKFQAGCFMSGFFRNGFDKKSEAKAQGNPAMSQAYKTIICSGYGFWGLRTKDRDGTVICSKSGNEYLQYLNTEKLINFREHDDGTMFCRVLKDLTVSDFNVGIANAISSYARLRLHSL